MDGDEEIVGFEESTYELTRHLIGGIKGLDVLPIVGMGGQGKTTCAKKLYNNDSIVSHFDLRAWCIISQTYNRRDLLQEIFSQITGIKDKGDKADELADMLKKRLKWKRYLIVLDDMWDNIAWDCLRLSFPDDGNRSRIIVTTRSEEICFLVKHHSDPHYLPFLTPEESSTLLQRKVFQKESFPDELYDVSLAVAQKCKGLPLVVILVAGVVKKKKMEASWWREVETALFSYLHGTKEYSMGTMQLSYDNLPVHIRPCLLYLGMFPEDHEIPVFKLIQLWIAEGFVQHVESARLEEVAEGYLTDLISSNLVMVSKRWYHGKVKYCQVHDIVLDFCLWKGKEEEFMSVFRGHPSQFRPSDWEENRVGFYFHFDRDGLVGSETGKPFNQQLRSVIASGVGFLGWNAFPQISKLRLLRVLDLSSFTMHYLSSATFNQLVHLNYLAVRTGVIDFQPETLLFNLRTLIVCGLELDIVLPATFWKMVMLRQFDIDRVELDFHYLDDSEQQITEESSKLENLKLLRRVRLSPQDVHDWVDMLSRRCPNLEEICICIRPSGGRTCNFELQGLTQLQTLEISSYVILPGFQLPSTLKKLTLQMPLITTETVSMIAKLPSLEYLKLEKSEFESEQWCLGEITFHKLKILKLMSLDISTWDASEESFPQLKILVISWCWKLGEIPLSFVDIQTLKQIKLIQCKNKSLEASTRQIKDEIEANEGIDRLNLIIEDS
ncbi:unnamed protein product [Withania somnifera]